MPERRYQNVPISCTTAIMTHLEFLERRVRDSSCRDAHLATFMAWSFVHIAITAIRYMWSEMLRRVSLSFGIRHA